MSGICEGRVVIVTGAGGGLGAAHARVLATEGACIVVNDINEEAAADAAYAACARIECASKYYRRDIGARQLHRG